MGPNTRLVVEVAMEAAAEVVEVEVAAAAAAAAAEACLQHAQVAADCCGVHARLPSEFPLARSCVELSLLNGPQASAAVWGSIPPARVPWTSMAAAQRLLLGPLLQPTSLSLPEAEG